MKLEQEDPELAELLEWVIKHNSKAKPQDKIVVDFDTGVADWAVARSKSKVGRNDPCPCGSEKKYKKCCGQNSI